MTQRASAGNFAASATVASWVLSPISARKKSTTVVPKTPKRFMRPSSVSSSSSLSGTSIQAAMAANETIRIQRRISGVMRVASTAPTPPAIAWLRTVATRMPQMMGAGLRNLAARQMAMSMVLSPISLAVTTPVERRRV